LKRHCTYCTYTHEDMRNILYNDSVYELYKSSGGIRNEDAAKSVSLSSPVDISDHLCSLLIS